MRTILMRTNYYQHFDADPNLEVPTEGFGGWKSVEIDLSLEHTALVSMHAWQFGTAEQYPGLYRAIEYIPRAGKILREVYPPLLAAAREAGMPVIHVVGGGDYYKDLPGYLETVRLAGEERPVLAGAPRDSAAEKLWEMKLRLGFPGGHNHADSRAGHEAVVFPLQARPLEGEPIAENTHQLNAVCRARGLSHLIYIGIAINWCLLMSPGGMIDMNRLGYLCSTIRQATTAVENKETARSELGKEIALWRVALAFGFVFDAEPFASALQTAATRK